MSLKSKSGPNAWKTGLLLVCRVWWAVGISITPGLDSDLYNHSRWKHFRWSQEAEVKIWMRDPWKIQVILGREWHPPPPPLPRKKKAVANISILLPRELYGNGHEVPRSAVWLKGNFSFTKWGTYLMSERSEGPCKFVFLPVMAIYAFLKLRSCHFEVFRTCNQT